MKPGLAVLPLEVWTDVFVYPWITREELAQIVHKFKNRKFAEKLLFRLHDYGKQTMRYLEISFKPSDKPKKNNPCKYELRKRKIPRCQANLAVAPHGVLTHSCYLFMPEYKDCEFPETDLPANMKHFKQLTIKHFDDDVLDFLNKINPLFTNVFLHVAPKMNCAKDLRILFIHLLPMLASIRGIFCSNKCVQFLEQHFPGTLAQAKELQLWAEPAFIPAYLGWLSAPQDFDQHGPRFLKITANTNVIIPIVNAVRQQFLAAATQSTFIIFIDFISEHWQTYPEHRASEFTLENAATNERLAVRNAVFQMPQYPEEDIRYVEIVRHPIGAEDKMREWINGRAYYEKKYNNEDEDGVRPYHEAERMIWIGGWSALTIGHITKKKEATAMDDQNEDVSADDSADEAGPSSSTKIVKK